MWTPDSADPRARVTSAWLRINTTSLRAYPENPNHFFTPVPPGPGAMEAQQRQSDQPGPANGAVRALSGPRQCGMRLRDIRSDELTSKKKIVPVEMSKKSRGLV
jgi:hypothetical protein